MTDPETVTISIAEADPVSGLWLAPPHAKACVVLAHGAGAGMAHRSMGAIATGLFDRNIATLRYQFPYMERGGKRVDSPAIAHAAVRAAVVHARRRADGLPLFAAGKSFGGRMTSQAQAEHPLQDVLGLIFFAFPLHPAGKPSVERAVHLSAIKIPMLFVSGTKDALADLDLLRTALVGLRDRQSLILLNDADHAFHVPAKSGLKDAEVLAQTLNETATWMDRIRADGSTK